MKIFQPNYVAVTDPEEGKRIMQEIYKYMPTIVMIDGKMVQIIAQQNGNVYYKAY